MLALITSCWTASLNPWNRGETVQVNTIYMLFYMLSIITQVFPILANPCPQAEASTRLPGFHPFSTRTPRGRENTTLRLMNFIIQGHRKEVSNYHVFVLV